MAMAMASHDTNSLLISSKFSDYNAFVEENLSLSPNGPFSHSISGSSYSSPLGSEIGSPETESEDEVTLAELTRRMAEFAFEDDDEEESYVDINSHSHKTVANSVFHENHEASVFYGGYHSKTVAYDYNHGLLMSASKPPAAALTQNLNSDNFNQINRMRNQAQLKNEEFESGGRKGKAADQKQQRTTNIQDKKAWKSSGNGKKVNSFSDGPMGGSGIRAVFLGGSDSTTKSSKGTGVFLPSGTYNKPEPKKKPTGCSTVLIPARVLQTLQQHFNNVGAKSQSQNTDVLARINGLLSQKQDQAVFQIQPPASASAIATNHVHHHDHNHDQEELRLPQEWTY